MNTKCTRIRRRKIRVLFVLVRVFTLFGDAQVFLGFRKVGLATQRLFELQDRLGEIAFAHENLTQAVLWLCESRVEIGCLLKILFCFGKTSLIKSQTSEVDTIID